MMGKGAYRSEIESNACKHGCVLGASWHRRVQQRGGWAEKLVGWVKCACQLAVAVDVWGGLVRAPVLIHDLTVT